MKLNSISFNRITILALIGGLMVFLLIPPITLGVPRHYPPAKFLFVFLLLINLDKSIFRRGNDLVLALMMLFLFGYIAFKNIESTNAFGFLSTFLLPLMFWARKDYVLATFKSFTEIYAYLILIPSVIYIMALLGVPIPHEVETSDPDASSIITYDVYMHICGVVNLRFAGFFSEPGVLGTFSAVLLVANQFKLRPVVLASLLLSGVLSFSFAFYVIIVLYVIFCSKSVKLIGGIAIIGAVLVYFFWDIFSELILERVMFEDGDLVSNRTTRDFDAWYSHFVQTSDFWWGLGNQASIKYDEMGASYKHLIVDYGMIFFVSFTATLALYAKSCIKKLRPWIGYLIILLGILYQRPFIELHSYLFVLYASIIAIAHSTQTSNTIKYENSSIDNLS